MGLPFLTQPAVATSCYVPAAGGQSQLFRGGQKLTRTPAVAGNRRKWTLVWVGTRHAQGSNPIFSVDRSGTDYVNLTFTGADKLALTLSAVPPNYGVEPASQRLFRDLAARLHLVISCDTEQALLADRVRLTINGVAEPVQTIPGYAALPLGFDTFVNGLFPHGFGSFVYSGAGGGGYLTGAECFGLLVDGLALPATAFGEFNIHGAWVAKSQSDILTAVAAAGGWGTNGAYHDFSDPAQPGKDVSGNGNHWTASGFDAAGKDTVAGSSTKVYATWDVLRKSSAHTLSDGNLRMVHGGSLTYPLGANMAARSGKFYFELTQVSGGSGSPSIGVQRTETINPTANTAPGYTADGWAITQAGNKLNGTSTNITTAFANNDVYRVAVDLDAGKIWFGKNGTWLESGAPESGENPSYSNVSGLITPAIGGSGATTVLNCGQRPFAYPVPVGFTGWCTDGLPEPEVKDPAEAFAQEIATGANIVAVLDAATADWGGQWVEIVKRRDAAESWRWRFGSDPTQALASDSPNAKAAAPALVAGGSYVGYRLRVGGRYGVWTAEVAHVTGVATTVTHGLGTSRALVIAKRVSVGGGDWYLRHPDAAAGKLFKLNSAAAAAADATLTGFDATGFQIAAAAPSGTYRVLVLAEVPGFITLTSHGGKGAADGAFIPTDTLPELVVGKGDAAGYDWAVFDAARYPVNAATAPLLLLDTTGVENPTGAAAYCDLVVGGVKARSNHTPINWAGITYYDLAIGRPIGGICVAPATAR